MFVNWVQALSSEELPPPREAPGGFSVPVIRKVNVAGHDLLLTRLNSGRAVAFATHCPHQGTPLDRAVLIGDQLRCAQHNYVYDPETGHNVRPSLQARSEALFRLKPGYLPTFAVREKEGWVWISDIPNPPPSGPPPRPMPPPSRYLPVPSEAETSPVQNVLEPKEIQSGEIFELDLATKPQPGHLWRLESTSGIVALAAQVFDETLGVYRIRLVAQKAGTEKIKLVFGKPWGGQSSNAVTLEIRVH